MAFAARRRYRERHTAYRISSDYRPSRPPLITIIDSRLVYYILCVDVYFSDVNQSAQR